MPTGCCGTSQLSNNLVERMIATRPANSTASTDGRTGAAGVRTLGQLSSLVSRLVLLACAGLVMQIGWIAVWTLSYRLTHGNDFTYTYLTTQPAVWLKLIDLLGLGSTLVPGMELPGFSGPASLDLVVNPLVM